MSYQSITQINPKKGSFLKNIDGSIWLYKGIEDAFVQLLCTESASNSVKKVGDTRKLNTYNAEFLFDWMPHQLVETADEDAEEIANTEEGEMHQLELEVFEQPITFEKMEKSQAELNLEGIHSILQLQNQATEGDEEFAEAEEVIEDEEEEIEEEPMAGPMEPEPNDEPQQEEKKKEKKPRAKKQEALQVVERMFWHSVRLKKCLFFKGFNDQGRLLFEDDTVVPFVPTEVEEYDEQDRFTTCGNLLLHMGRPEMIVTTGGFRISHGGREFEAIVIGGNKEWFEMDYGWKYKAL
jgi:hypothetical protein